MRRQDPRKLYAAHVVGLAKPAPAWEQISAEDHARWTCVALAAAGLDLERIDPAFKQLAEQLVLRGPGGALIGQPELYWQLRLWGRMAAHSPAPPLDVSHVDLACAFAMLARLGVDPLLGALEQVGDRPVASALMHSLAAAGVAGGGLGCAIAPYHLYRVGRALERIAGCYDLLEQDGEARREGKILRAAAWHCDAGGKAQEAARGERVRGVA